jgi:hypothetical protein
VLVVVGLVLVASQRSLEVLLGHIKAEALSDLNYRLSDLMLVPENASQTEILRRMHGMNALLHQTRQVESFTPTLIDGRFALQVALSTTAIIIANVLLRLALN